VRLHRLVASAILVGGCSFQLTPAGAIDAAPGDGSGSDAATDAPSDASVVPTCLGALCRRTTLTIEATRVTGGPHVGFPVLVDIQLPAFAASAAPTGFDLTFTSADGVTRIPYERELFANGRLVAWVRLPTINSTTNTVFYLFFGNPAATVDAQSRNEVWGSEYHGVWHANEVTGGNRAILDSTSSLNHGTNQGGLVLGVAGKIGRSIQLDGIDDRLRIATTTELEQATAVSTLSTWVSFDAAENGAYQRILMTANAIAGDGTGVEWGLQPLGSQMLHYYYPQGAGGSNYIAIPNTFTPGRWHHVAITQDFAAKALAMYVDGALITPVSNDAATLWTTRPTPSDWFWGGAPPRTEMAGLLDEMRIAKLVRSAGWISTEHTNQKSAFDFIVVGPTNVGP